MTPSKGGPIRLEAGPSGLCPGPYPLSGQAVKFDR
eukprot:CAMPEP_0180159874 /NCGR_PEP_ID=MMETSP0986-20121125/27776_1 /TAXON_ID=697907 /ORGANISM="non described non described, Strain CCMP2293" /LENGTH=34 /DNA_ID= /DNA_START= /DNA_END= /DNA_ORIENTATION=